MSSFSIRKTYKNKIIKEQAKYISVDENGEAVTLSNPYEGVPPTAKLADKPATTSAPRPNAGFNVSQGSSFKMRKSFYVVADR